ncbi:MAG TPA: imelysin family protein, partial [bacterium]
LTAYTQDVVTTTYNAMCHAAEDLQTAVTTLQADPSDVNVAAARDAWLAVREPWERSEAFLFGPVESNGVDPAVDSWPLDLSAVSSGLASGGTYGLTNPETKGFHAIEYALWAITGTKNDSAANVAANLALDSDKTRNLGTIVSDMVKRARIVSNAWVTSYGGGFIKSGNGGNHVSQKSALQEMIEAMAGIADEVGTGKIGGPVNGTGDDPENDVESQFSFNSITDFHNNILGIKIAYLGEYADTPTQQSGSLSALVADSDVDLDGAVVAAINDAIAKIDLISVSDFHDGDPAGATGGAAAITALGTLADLLNGDLKDFLDTVAFSH